MLLTKILSLVLIVASSLTLACSTFCGGNGESFVFGKSYDWNLEHGLVLVNKKNVAKRALLLDRALTPLTWTSKFGSITFNQYGREFPLGGMNEAGLTVEIMWLDSSIYPKPDNRPVVNELQWIQYQLDSFTSVAEVAAEANDYRVISAYAKVHYLVCDATKSCLTFEFVDGKLVTRSGQTLPAAALTNHTYDDSIKYAQKFQGLGGTLPLPQSKSSLDRFARAAYFAKHTASPINSLTDAAFDTLSGVSQGEYSKWNIVYEPKAYKIHFRTRLQPGIKTVEFKKFDYSCKTPVQMLDVNFSEAGVSNSKFQAYTHAANREMLEKSLKNILGSFPPGSLERLATYPELLKCQE